MADGGGEVKKGDRVQIVKSYCADKMYVGLKGVIIKDFSDFVHSKMIKIELPKDNKRYYLGDEPAFPSYCLRKIKVLQGRRNCQDSKV